MLLSPPGSFAAIELGQGQPGLVSDLHIRSFGTPTNGCFLDATGWHFVVGGVEVTTISAAGITQADLLKMTLTGSSITTQTQLDMSTLDTLSTGVGVKLASSSNVIATTGRLFSSYHSGTLSTSGVLNEFKSDATDETEILKVTASGILALGVALDVSVAAMTTGTGIKVTPTALTTGMAVSVSSLNALTTGIGFNLVSGATAITGAGRLAYINHTGVSTSTGTLAEIASAAADNTVIMKVTASGILALGKAFAISVAAMTTGIGLDISDANALTSGGILNLASNSADTSARALAAIANSNALATSTNLLYLNNTSTAAPLKINSGVVSTHFKRIALKGTVTEWVSDGTDPNGALSGTAGDICLNGASNKPAYCTGTTNWVNLV